MNEKRLSNLFIILNLVLINGAILAVMNMKYPLVGHDYTLALPSLLDTALHYRLNGFAIQWFTPTFGGGIPIFPNPNNMQYSIPTLLAAILPPWQSIMTSVVIYVSAGFLACYYFFHRILKLQWTASILGALFFSLNGFIIARMTTGQLGYISFTLVAVFLILLLDPALPTNISAPLLGLLVAMYIHSAGYFILIIFSLSILIVLPPLFIYKPDLFRWKHFFTVLTVGGVLGIIIALSKLAASFSFMRFFPRFIADEYTSSLPLGIVGILLELLGTQNLVPLFLIGNINPAGYVLLIRWAIGMGYSIWELDMSLTPVVFAIVGICTLKFLRHPKKYLVLPQSNQSRFALILFAIFTWIAIEFTLAKGLVYPLLRHLPILSSLRGNVRFGGAFIFPLALFAAVMYQRWSKSWNAEKSLRLFLLVNALAIMPVISYFLFRDDAFFMPYNLAGPQKIYADMQAGDTFEITSVGIVPGKNTGALLNRTSNLNVYEPVFGFKLESFHPQVTSGSVWNISDGYYNLTDPTGYVYPELNNNKPFDRFRIADRETMELFVKHIQPEWKIPARQLALNKISLITLILTLAYLLLHSVRSKLLLKP